LSATDVIIDAPPGSREVEFQVDIWFPKEDRYRPLGDVSPVVRALAGTQFDDYVKRVRIFARPGLVRPMASIADLPARIAQVVRSIG